MKTPAIHPPSVLKHYTDCFLLCLLIDGIVPTLLYLIYPWRWFLDFALAFQLMGWMDVADTISELRKGKEWATKIYGLPAKIPAALLHTCLLVYILLF